MPWSYYAMDRYIAPGISEFESATIPDMSETDTQQNFWRLNYILSTMMRGTFEPPFRQQLFNFLRRTTSAFRTYGEARRLTLEFLEQRQSATLYLDAMDQWEAFLGYACHAVRSLGRSSKTRWFEPDDGSVLQRLNLLYNATKHAEGTIEAGRFLEDAPLCVWLTREGLRDADGVTLAFAEMGTLLEDLARYASAVQDPSTMMEKMKAADAEAKAMGD